MEEQENRDDLVGCVLDGRYRVNKILGEGGMGAVFQGEHVVIGRQVAIKVLSAKLAKSPDFVARFQREAIAAGRLDHPNCVPVTDSGYLEDGSAYLVMELVDGRSLRALLKDAGPQLDPVRALRIARHVLRGLGHAHKVGIVHRDVKPDNIMVTVREDNHDYARILDFGIAKLRDAENEGKEALTQVGVAVGTPTYLSPEQALGEPIDHRSDLYSCAVLLFEMLCGRPPYVADNPVGILTKHATSEIPHLWDFAPELSEMPQLDSVVQRGLLKSRVERYDSAEAFVRAIDEALHSLGSQLTPMPSTKGSSESAPYQIPLLTPTPALQTSPQPAVARVEGGGAVTGAAPTAVSSLAPTNATAFPPRSGQRVTRKVKQIAGLAALLSAAILAIVLSTGNRSHGPLVNAGKLFDDYASQLEEGETCSERLSAVNGLRKLGDKRALPLLKKARRRMRGGVLGIGKKNTNHCLRKEAQEAIRELEGT